LRWDPKVLDALFASALLGYLAIAHHGRGRGAWVAQDPPTAWVVAVDEAMVAQRAALDALWLRPVGQSDSTPSAPLAARIQRLIEPTCIDVLDRLYPTARTTSQHGAVEATASALPLR
jgi:hypothetical protein